jgi:hypothetical protein
MSTFDKNPDLLFQFQLARELKLSVRQVRQFSVLEFTMWAAFFAREHKEQQRQQQKSFKKRR